MFIMVRKINFKEYIESSFSDIAPDFGYLKLDNIDPSQGIIWFKDYYSKNTEVEDFIEVNVKDRTGKVTVFYYGYNSDYDGYDYGNEITDEINIKRVLTKDDFRKLDKELQRFIKKVNF